MTIRTHRFFCAPCSDWISNFRGRAISVLVLVSFLSCGGGEGPTDPGGGAPDIRGTYTSSQFLILRVTPQFGSVATLRCPGRITIANQVGGRFSGSLVWGPGGDCTTMASSFDVVGDVRDGGAISHGATRPGGSDGDWAGALGCTVIAADRNFTGAVSGRRFTSSAAAVMDCVREGRLRFDVTMDGTR